MSIFISLSEQELAIQIANLLNKYNKLTRKHDSQTILNPSTDYFVELRDGKVVGCVGLTKESSLLSKLHHLSVDSSFRRQGIATKLINMALSNCVTGNIYATVREDNIESTKLMLKNNFKCVNITHNGQTHILRFGRRGR
jgi:predicted acetyltransferase